MVACLCGCRCRPVCQYTTCEISQQLLDGLPWYFVQTFMVPRGWIPIALVIPWLLLEGRHEADICSFKRVLHRFSIALLYSRLDSYTDSRWTEKKSIKINAAEPEIPSFIFHAFFLSKPGAYITHNATRPPTVWRRLGCIWDEELQRSGDLSSVWLHTPRFFSFSDLWSSAPTDVTSATKGFI